MQIKCKIIQERIFEVVENFKTKLKKNFLKNYYI